MATEPEMGETRNADGDDATSAPPWAAWARTLADGPGALGDPTGLASLAQRGVQDAMDFVAATMRGNAAGTTGSAFGARPVDSASEPTDRMDTAEAFRTIDTWADFAKGVIERLSAPPASQPADAAIRVSARPGETATVEWWVTNLGFDESPTVTPTATPASNGSSDLTGVVRFHPELVPPLPARSSRAIVVEVEVAPGAEVGCYRSLMQAAPVLDAWQVLEIVIEGADGA